MSKKRRSKKQLAKSQKTSGWVYSESYLHVFHVIRTTAFDFRSSNRHRWLSKPTFSAWGWLLLVRDADGVSGFSWAPRVGMRSTVPCSSTRNIRRYLCPVKNSALVSLAAMFVGAFSPSPLPERQVIALHFLLQWNRLNNLPIHRQCQSRGQNSQFALIYPHLPTGFQNKPGSLIFRQEDGLDIPTWYCWQPK